MAKGKPPVVDPELERQLDAAEGDGPVQAVFTLQAPKTNPVLAADDVRSAVARIVQSAKAACGQDVSDLHVMPTAQSFSVAAPAGMVRAILKNREVAAAIANVQREDIGIGGVPVARKKPATRNGGKTRRTK